MRPFKLLLLLLGCRPSADKGIDLGDMANGLLHPGGLVLGHQVDQVLSRTIGSGSIGADRTHAGECISLTHKGGSDRTMYRQY
jgi:hypothetical protein